MTAADRTKRHTHTNTNDADTTTQTQAAREDLLSEAALLAMTWESNPQLATLDALVAELDRLRGAKRFPVARTDGQTIPWPLAEQAYLVYSKLYGTSQSLERLGERGGFHPEELDEFVPGWRPMERALAKARAELERLRGERDAYKRAKAENDERFMIERDEARAELERITREREIDATEHRGTYELARHWKRKYEGAEAELVAAAGREQRLRDAGLALLGMVDRWFTPGDYLPDEAVVVEAFRAVLEEGQQPRPTMAEALDAAGMLRDPEMEEGQP